MSSTATEPLATRTSVPSQRSTVSHFVPRIVADAKRPLVRNLPEPEPHSCRTTFGFFLRAPVASPALAAFGHDLKLPPASLSVVSA